MCVNEVGDTVAAERLRRQTFRRWMGGIVCFLVLILGIRWIWGYVAESRLEAEIDRIRAAGERIVPSDFEVDRLPTPDENAAVDFRRATDAMRKVSSGSVEFEEMTLYPGSFRLHVTDFCNIVEENRAALSYLRAARSKSKAVYRIVLTARMGSGGIDENSFHLREMNDLLQLLIISAWCHHERGDDAAALDDVIDLFTALERLRAPELKGYFGALFRAKLLAPDALDTVEDLIAGLNIEKQGADASGSSMRPASDKQIKSLVDLLLNDESVWNALDDDYVWNRASGVEAMDAILRDPSQRRNGALSETMLLRGSMGYLFAGPIIQLDTVRLIDTFKPFRAALKRRSWPDMQRAMKDRWSPRDAANNIERLTRTFSEGQVGSIGRRAELAFREVARRRMAATALALRQYERDSGKKPDSLESLVPQYLDRVPADPFHSDQQAIRFLPDSNQMLLYSVNAGGIDDGGAFESDDMLGVNPNVLDLVYFLDRNRPQRDALDLSTIGD